MVSPLRTAADTAGQLSALGEIPRADQATSVSQERTSYHFFNLRVGPGPDAKAQAMDVKHFHSPSQQVFHRKVPLIVFQYEAGSGSDAKAEAVDIKCFHSSPKEMSHRKIPHMILSM